MSDGRRDTRGGKGWGGGVIVSRDGEPVAAVHAPSCPRCGRTLMRDEGGDGHPDVFYCPKGTCPYQEPAGVGVQKALTYDDLRPPWTLRPDPDGPTRVLNRDGACVAEVEPRYAAAVASVPEMLTALGRSIFPVTECYCADMVFSRCHHCEARAVFARAGLPVAGAGGSGHGD